MRKKLLLSLSFLLYSLYFSVSFAQTGDVTWEKFKPFTGTLADLSVAVNPVETQLLTSIDAPKDIDDSYGARIRGYIVPAETGSYTFYVASDDNGEFWLSTDILPENKSLKCFVLSWAGYKVWNKEPVNQKSAAIELEAGSYYYFEALVKEGSGGDHLEIGWTTPANSAITIISAANISNEAIVDSTLTEIETFTFADLGVPVEGVVDSVSRTVTIEVPFGSDLTALIPEIKTSFGAGVSPVSGVAADFTNPVDFTVTSADGDFTSVFTVTVSVAEARSDNSVSNVSFQYPVTSIPAVVDDINNTITVELYSGLGLVCNMNYTKDYFAQASIESGTEVDLGSVSNLTVTAQNGDIRVYDLVVSELPGVTAFTDEFTDDSNLSGWLPRNWNNSGGSSVFQMSHDATEEALKITKTTAINDYIVFNFPDELNFGIVEPRLRFRVKSETPLSNFQAKFRDYSNPSPDGNFSIATDWNTMPVPADGVYHEAIWDFSSKMRTVNRFRISQLVLGVDRTITAALPGVFVDDFRVGADAYANQKPLINSVSKPDWKYIDEGLQSIELTGISDGNPEREESLTLTASSSNQTVVKDEDISIEYIAGSETATLSYAGSSNGTAVITITVTDDRGTVYSDEFDTETTSFVAEFRDATPGVNDVATFGMPQFTHVNVGAGHQHYVIISNVDDGDEDVEQDITFSFVNNSETMITVDSISFTPGNNFAILYFHDKGMTGSANVTVSCIDEVDELAGGTPYEMSFDIPLGTYSTFGAYYGATQIAQWQTHPYKQDPVFKDNYPITISQANVTDHCKDDFFWGMMWGYIIAPVSGTYKFYSTTEGEGIGQFYLSSNTSREGLPPIESPTASNGQASAFVELEAGKAYYFEAFHKEIINDYFLRLEWVYPGITDKVIIQAPYLFSMIDMIKPAVATNLRLKAKGSSLALVEWDAASDNLSVKGYMVYVNGVAYTAEPINTTSIMIEGLQPDSKNDVFVIAVDQLKNYSDPSGILSFTTWGNDEIPPTVPENLVVTETTAFSISVSWDASTDAETEVFGYNVYLNGSTEATNTQAIIGTSYKLSGLEITSNYSIQVSALDASLNESGLSSPVAETTNEFTWDDPNEDAHIGKATVTFEPLALASGFAIEGGYGLNSIFLSNKVSYNSFEGEAFKNNMTNESLLTVGKEKSSGVSYFAETTDVFHGEKSARLQVGPGDWIRVISSINMTQDFQYLLRFGAKKGMGYDGTIQFRVYRDNGGVVNAYTGSVTPGDEWEQFEIEFPGILDASQTWKIEFLFNKMGEVYLDDIQFHIKEWYDPDSKFAKPGIQILEELKPAAIRWGAIDANYESFGESVGQYQQTGLTLGDFAELSSMYGDYALLTVGVNSATDWIKDKNTFANFIEYLAGPAGTTWGDVRIAEGYAEPFDEVLKSIIIELGNEVWGYSAHGADAFSDSYVTYANWARDVTTNYLKNSPYYNSEKMFIAFSGRSPDNNYGLHSALFTGDEGEMDMLGISGYLGGNMNYDPAIDPGVSQLDYHKNSYANFKAKIAGLNAIFKDMFQMMNRYVPMYMYEGNLTRNEYHGTLGQAVSFADYYAACMENGVAVPDVFALEGGQWRILDNAVNLKKRPLYYMVQYFNSFCKGGVVLKTDYQSVDPIYNDNGFTIDLPSVGVHAYNNGDQYGIALFSRDFENDYKISLDLPADIGVASEGEMVIVSGEMFNSLTATVETQAITVTDGMIITVPKHSAVFITFKADSRTYDPMPELGQLNYTKVSSIDLFTEDGEYVIDESKGRKKLNYTVLPADAFYLNIDLKIVENTANAGLSSSRNLTADGTTDGSVTVRASAKDGSGIYDEVTIEITNQAVSVEDFNKLGIKVYPNPASEYLIIDMGEIKEAVVTLRNVHGSVVKKINVDGSLTDLKIGDLSQGVYFMEVQTSNGRQIFRFVKQ